MQLAGRDAVDLTLDRRDHLESCMSRARDSFGNLERIDESMDLRHRSPVRLWRNLEVHFDALYSRSLNVGDPDFDSIEAQGGRQPLQPGLVEPDIDKSAEEHVPGDAARGVEDRNLHLTEGGSELVLEFRS